MGCCRSRRTTKPLSILLSLFLLSCRAANSDINNSLINFLLKLSDGDSHTAQKLVWNAASDPCADDPNTWQGVTCTTKKNHPAIIRSIDLRSLPLGGTLDATLLCAAVPSLALLTLSNTALRGSLPASISNCTQLIHLNISGNFLTGELPPSLATLNNLKRLDISNNNFSGQLPAGLIAISGLVVFLANNNNLTGSIPPLRFANLVRFNVSGNFLSGPIPPGGELFSPASYAGNPGLCGEAVSHLRRCPPAAAESPKRSKKVQTKIKIASGYILLALVVTLFCTYKLYTRKSGRQTNGFGGGGDHKRSSSSTRPISTTTTTTTNAKEESSASESGMMIMTSSSLAVLSSKAREMMTFEELLKAPAELLGRGEYGSLYKVLFHDGVTLAVKRIKDQSMSGDNFKRRMELIDDAARHPNVLPAVAFYCSNNEKLVVYEYKKNGSLFKILHGNGTPGRQALGRGRRLRIAAGIAQGLAFMHQQLRADEISHGNLKTSNIMIDDNMEACISEYGLRYSNDQNLLSTQASASATVKIAKDQLKADVYSFGILLLELLSGKQVESDGFDLASWVQNVVREEWTMEVFDKDLVSDGDNQERMVHLLRLALKCMDHSPEARPEMERVAELIIAMKEEEEEEETLVYDSP